VLGRFQGRLRWKQRRHLEVPLASAALRALKGRRELGMTAVLTRINTNAPHRVLRVPN
jgi:hypothetical protein